MLKPALPRFRHGLWEFPVHHMRGGTSTGLVIWGGAAPPDLAAREELLRHLMGVPQHGSAAANRQITGLGRGPATSNKVFFCDIESTAEGPRLVSTLAQLAADHASVDWSVNCGNMSSALQLWALDTGLVQLGSPGPQVLHIRNTNTGVLTTSRMNARTGGGFEHAVIPGVLGWWPAVDLFLHHPAGAKTGKLLPTGKPFDAIQGVRVSCVDVAVPMVIANAADFGKTAHEDVRELAADAEFMDRFKAVWIEAGLRMGLRRKDGTPMSREEISRSETIPKACIVGAAKEGGDIAVRYLTPQTVHSSMAVTGGCCLAAATLIPGTVAHQLCPKQVEAGGETAVHIENPAGVLSTAVEAAWTDGSLQIRSAAYQRSTQVLLEGFVPIYNASELLATALEGQAVAH
jgi:4-oxalomesaconate tautomerase